MSRERNIGHNATETKFVRAILESDLQITQGKPIRCHEPVPDKNGKPKKTVTTPDFTLTDPLTGNEGQVEITKGNGHNPHKAAQLRVVNQAGCNGSYRVLTGEEVDEIAEAEPKQRGSLIRKIFGW